MHEPSKRRAGRIRALIVTGGLIVAMAGMIVWYSQKPDVLTPTWGGAYTDFCTSIWGDGMGSLYTCGVSDSSGLGSYDIALVKWNYAGNVLWNRTWGGFGYECGTGVGGDARSIYTTGFTTSFGAGSYDMVLVKWDPAGNVLWNRTWGGTDEDHGYSVWCDKTNVYTCGYTKDFSKGNGNVVLVKWDPAGNLLWNRTWCRPSESSSAYGLWGDGTSIYTTGDFGLIKWDPSGNVLWSRAWNYTSPVFGGSVWGNGASIYTCGFTNNLGASFDMVLVKWDAAGNELWIHTWGGASDEYALDVWGDGTNVYICGSTDSFGAGRDDMVLVKWDDAGNQIWYHTWGDACYDAACGVWGNNVSIYTCGYTQSHDGDMALVKWTQHPYGITHFPDPRIICISLIAVSVAGVWVNNHCKSGNHYNKVRHQTSTGAVRHRLTSDDWIREAAPAQSARAI